MNRVTINGKTYEGRSIEVKGGKVTIDGQPAGEAVKRVEVVVLSGDTLSIKADGDVRAGKVLGNVDAGGVVACDDVGGNVDAGGSVTCHNVKGDVDAGDSVMCDNVGGNVDAGGSVRRGP